MASLDYPNETIQAFDRLQSMKKATRRHTKLHNKQLILQTIYSRGKVSRAKIALLTDLTRTTVSNNVTELIEDVLVKEVGYGLSKGGKRPILLSIIDDSRSLIGIDLGNSEFRGGIFNLRGKMLHSISLSVNDCQGEAAVDLLYTLIDQLTDCVTSHIVGVGIGAPGITDTQNGLVYEAVNLGWHNLPLKELLETRYSFPIHVANDSQLAALGEYTFGKQKDISNLVVVKLGRGISAGIVFDGQLYMGERSGQGEIGHIGVVENGDLCRCGNFGCLETVASTRAVVKQAQEIARNDKDCALLLAANSIEAINIDTVLDAYEAGDPHMRVVIERTGYYVGFIIANLAAILNIQHIVIGGRMARFGDGLIRAIRHEMEKRLLPKIAQETEISISSLGQDIVIKGGAALLLSRELKVV